MGGIFGGQGAGGQNLPAMSGFDANAVAQALQQAGVGNNAQSGVTPGVPASATGMVNPLAQMLAAQGPTYQPSDTTWGIKGDRLMRYTPQEGNKRDDGTGAGGLPPINANEDSMAYMLRIGMSQADADKALAMSKANPNMSFQDIMAQMHSGGGTGALPGSTPTGLQGGGVDWAKLQSAMAAPPPAPPGAPAINTAMEKLKPPTNIPGQFDAQGRYIGPVPTAAEVAALGAAWKAIANAPMSERRAPDWYARKTAAEQAYIEAQKRTGYGPGGYVRG